MPTDGDGSASVAAIPYFENVFPFMAGVGLRRRKRHPGHLHQRVGSLPLPIRRHLRPCRHRLLHQLYGFYNVPSNWQPHFWQNQFSSLYSLDSIGMSYYNAGQVTLRHPSSHGLSMDVSYTYSRSIDMGSDAERAGGWATGSFSDILNTWKPSLNRGVSDFDTKHLVTVDWVYQLPFGRGKALLAKLQQGPRCSRRRLAMVGHQPRVQRLALVAL